ncbi:hypothetical protein Pve01_67250 [Planomonospora venezuelensis]|nr:hypothetical protein Pve01_67250 [Planomonospora venezuelensis]
MAISLDLFRTFLAVHRTGSVTAAAHTLGLSQPAVSAQVRALETALERRLFDRLPRGVAPTPAADELARRLAAPLDALEEAVGAGPGPEAWCTWAVPPSCSPPASCARSSRCSPGA